jgi:hypothetical protein
MDMNLFCEGSTTATMKPVPTQELLVSSSKNVTRSRHPNLIWNLPCQ